MSNHFGDKERPVNIVKLLAEERLTSVMKKIGVDDTPASREDILALALNELPSKYVNTQGGRLYAQLVENYKVQYETDVLRSLTKAAIKVKEKPRGLEQGE
jgi:competence protein ComFB